MWIAPDTQQDQVGAPGEGSTELMVWINAQDMVPGGDYLGNVRLRERRGGIWDESTYSVYRAPQWGNGWQYLAFVRSPAIAKGVEAVNLRDAIDYAMSQDWLKPTDWLIAVEAGFEIYSGGENLTLDDFAVIIDQHP